ncbi:MAG: radical SAM family heme chaperone HemW [Gemmatimonadota bacterium]
MLVYLHVPFCARRCSYCDFAIAVRRETPSAGFVEAFEREWRQRLLHPAWADSTTVRTIYLGGGTPSRLDPGALGDLVGIMTADRNLVEGAEVTLEANPDDVTPAKATAWSRAGINRISLGVQSFSPSVLAWMHRTHQADQVAPAVEAIRAAGIGNISIDLIYGLPAAMGRRWEDDLDQAFALAPEHLSLYALTLEAHTPLAHWVDRGTSAAPPADQAADEFLTASARLRSEGFEHYEVSNAARPGHRAVHNSGYWRRDAFLGMGPSAHSAWGRYRSWNVREWEAWRRAVLAGRDPEQGREVLDDRQALLESRYLGLRTDHGVPDAMVPAPHRAQWQAQGWAETAGGRVRLLPEGWLRLDSLVASLPDDS